jgi:hypothetical protein
VTPEKRIEEVLGVHARRCDYNHPQYGNCRCGFDVDLPQDHHAHVAAAVVEALGEVFYKRGRYFFGEALDEDHPKLPFVKCLCGAEATAERPE